MTPAMAAVLRALVREGAPSLAEVARAVGRSKTNVVKQVQIAEVLGLVERTQERVRCWRVTAQGRAACARRAA